MITRTVIAIIFILGIIHNLPARYNSYGSSFSIAQPTQDSRHALSQFLKSYTVIEKDMKKGLLNEKGDLIIPAIYDDLGWTKGSFAVINEVLGYKQNNNWGLLALNNKKYT